MSVQPTHLTGSLFVTGSVSASLGFDGLSNVFSASAQVAHDSTTGFVSAEHVDHSGVSITGTGALTGGGTIEASRTIALDTSAATFTNGVVASLPTGTVSASAQTIANLPTGTVSASAQIDGDFLKEEGENVISSSAQISHDDTTGFVSSEHIDHSSITIGSGKGLDGGGTIDTSRSIFLATGSSHFTDGVKDKLNADTVISSSAQVDHDSTTNFASSEHFTQANITTVGTIGTGVWQGTAIASAYLDADTAHLTTAQTFTGEKKFATDVTVSGSLIVSSSIGDNPFGILVKGAVSASGDVIAFQSSDERLKDNIQPIESPLEKIFQINGVSFDWNNKQDLYSGRDVGVIAQEIESVLPEIVQTRESGMKAVRYEKIVALLIEAIKEQQLQIDELKARL